MKRAIHLFPELPPEVLGFREKHDPLGKKIPPHITLVFPFEDELPSEELRDHLVRHMDAAGRIAFELGQPEIGDGGYVWLPVTKGREEVIDLHDALYSGPLLRHLSASHEYVPHVTVARTSPASVQRIYSLACTLPKNLPGVLDSVIVERIAQDDTSEILWNFTLNDRTSRRRQSREAGASQGAAWGLAL